MKIKNIVQKVLPAGILRILRDWKIKHYLKQLERKSKILKPGTIMPCLNYTVHIHDGVVFYVTVKDILFNHIYYFKPKNPDPLILDCGCNIGISILYFKHLYPQAKIIGFEPDPIIFPILRKNVIRNHLTDVQLIQAGVSGQSGTLTFYSDAKWGSMLAEEKQKQLPQGWTKYEVPVVRLRDYINRPVDFLKVNIEGAEHEVLADIEDLLYMIREIVIEYHHFPGLPRTLHKILDILHRQRFEYCVSDFGLQNYGASRPPVSLRPDARYCRHVYACRLE